MLAIAVGSEVAHFRKRIESEFRAVLGGFAQRLDELGALADGMTVTTATDILWTLNHPDTWYLLVYG